jgi:NAD(P)-dependent dehydrogenase (short-subunit alcohol dehydrogenase family)
MTTIQINPNELSNKRVLVTGRTKGMGEAIVNRLLQAGATVITTARSKPDKLRSPDLFIQSDISTPDGVKKIVKEVFARLGGVDILINNVDSSSTPSGGVLALSDEDWQQTFNANLFAAVRLDRAFLPQMLEQGVVLQKLFENRKIL